LVLGGTAEIYEDAEAAGKIIATAESGALLGELAMLANAAYGVTVKTTSPFVAKRIERELFIRLAHEFPEFGAAIMRNIVTRLGRSVAALVQVKAMFEA
jgi:CRP-like cAMP-binding protein